MIALMESLALVRLPYQAHRQGLDGDLMAAAPTAAGRGQILTLLRRQALRLAGAVCRWQRRRAAIRGLRALNAHQLADLGLEPARLQAASLLETPPSATEPAWRDCGAAGWRLALCCR